MPVDSGRGEVEIQIDGSTRILRLTNRRQRTLALALGVEGLIQVQDRLNELDTATIITILEHGLDDTMTRDELEDAVIPLVPAVSAIAEAMMLATWGPGGPPAADDPPEAEAGESLGDGTSN